MKTTKLFILICAISLNTIIAQENSANDGKQTAEKSYLELPRIEVIPITDTKTDRQYELYIKLPEGYSENNDIKYPVIYFTDAMWHIEILSGSTEFLMENAILVGISWEKDLKGELGALGAHASRFRDYQIQPSSNPEAQAKYQLGQASNHLDFIRNDVIKYIENNYRTDPERRAYFGYSTGGLFGAYILLTQPDTFKNYILGSPALEGEIPFLSKLGAKAALKAKGLNASVFISYGDLERGSSPYTDEFIAMLKNRNDESLSLKHVVVEGNHHTAFPMTGVRSVQWLSQMNNFPVQGGPYFGQKPPGLIPEIFAPGIVSINGRHEGGISFSPDLDEVYFGASKEGEDSDIYFSKLVGKKWAQIKKANFTKGKKDVEMHPFVSPNGKRIYFTAINSDFTDNKIWYVDRLDNAWSNAIKLDSPINDDEVFYSIQAKNEDLYYFNISKRKTYYAPNINGSFPKVKEVEIEFGVHAFISPSQDYLVVNARNKEDDSRKSDLYVYFKKKDGAWTKPINLGDTVNSNFLETVPSVTPDGKYLFFSRYNEEGGLSNFYWVSAEVINRLRPDN